MRVLKQSFFLFFVLASGYARSQCTNLRFTLTSGNAWPTVNPLPGNPQRICLQQNLASAGATVRVYTSAPVAISGVSWTVLGTGISKVAPENNQECGFQTTTPGTPFDFGKARVVVRYTAGLCGCIDTLDIFRQMNPAATSSFAPIQGPVCLVPGAKGAYYVDPRFSRPANINLGIGLDGYNWSILNNGSTGATGVGTWSIGPTTTPSVLLSSGDISSLEILAPSSGWNASTATLRVVQGNACNTVQTPLTISKGAAPATITATAIDAAFTNSTGTASQVNNNGTQNVSACLNAGTSNTPITLTAPTGNTYVWTLPVGGGFTLASGTLTSQTITVNAAGNRSGIIQVTCSPASGSCGLPTTATFRVSRRLTTANTITPATPTCLQPGNYTFTISNFPPDGPTAFNGNPAFNVIPPAGSTNIAVGAINSSGQFVVTISTGATLATTPFSLTATPAVGYGCTGNSASLGDLTVPGSGTNNFVLEAYDNFPAASTPVGVAKRTVYWNETPIITGNSTTIPANITWGGALGGTCDETIFTYAWRFTGMINGVMYIDATPTTNLGQGTPFTSTNPLGSATLRAGVTYGTAGTPACTITCTITSSSPCNGTSGPSAYNCYSRTHSLPFNGPTTPLARPGGNGGDPSSSFNIIESRPNIVIPNPTKGNFRVDVSDLFVGGNAVLIDFNGKEVHRLDKLEKSQEVRVKNLPTGIYSMFFFNGEEADQVTIQIER